MMSSPIRRRLLRLVMRPSRWRWRHARSPPTRLAVAINRSDRGELRLVGAETNGLATLLRTTPFPSSLPMQAAPTAGRRSPRGPRAPKPRPTQRFSGTIRAVPPALRPPMQPLIDAIAALTPPTDAGRIFHGRGGLHPGCEQWTLDAYPPVLLLTSFQAIQRC